MTNRKILSADDMPGEHPAQYARVTVAEWAAWCGVTDRRVRAWMQAGDLPPVQRGGGWTAHTLLTHIARVFGGQLGKVTAETLSHKDRLTKAKADMEELKLKRAVGDLLTRDAVAAVTESLAIELRRVVAGLDIPKSERERISRQLATMDVDSVMSRIDAEDEDSMPDETEEPDE